MLSTKQGILCLLGLLLIVTPAVAGEIHPALKDVEESFPSRVVQGEVIVK